MVIVPAAAAGLAGLLEEEGVEEVFTVILHPTAANATVFPAEFTLTARL